jgi:hypothetical protein
MKRQAQIHLARRLAPARARWYQRNRHREMRVALSQKPGIKSVRPWPRIDIATMKK